MKVSVVVTIYNNESTILRVVNAIRKSSYQNIEIILVDDGSTDKSLKLITSTAKNQHVFRLTENRGRVYARNYGFEKATGDIIVNVDSDVVIQKNTIQTVVTYLTEHSEVSAVTGRVQKTSEYENFASVYKNLYMHYYFGLLPKEVNFLYGSFFAIRKTAYKKIPHSSQVKIADDTSLGQALIYENFTIHLNKNLMVNHLKRFTLWSLIKNDFTISSDWAYLFIQYSGWTQLFKKNTGYAHASKGQIASITLIGAVVFLPLLFAYSKTLAIGVSMFIGLLLVCINRTFFAYLSSQPLLFFIKAISWTILDYGIMLCGISHGIFKYMLNKKNTLV